MSGGRTSQPDDRRWATCARVVTAHVVMLRDEGHFGDEVLAALLTAIDGAKRGQPPEAETTADLIAAFDGRVAALTPAGAVGAAALGRSGLEVEAAIARLTLRDGVLAAFGAMGQVRLTLHALATEHAGTITPASLAGRPAPPTTLAHLLGGVLGPMGRLATAGRVVVANLDSSPLGAGVGMSTAVGIDRERVAALLGFGGLVVNTVDAVAATDGLVGASDWAAEVAVTVSRVANEWLGWSGQVPGVIGLAGGGGDGMRGGLPSTGEAETGLGRVAALARAVTVEADEARDVAHALGFGPVAVLDGVVTPAVAAVRGVGEALVAFATLVPRLVFNRAALANRAGKGHVTSGDLAVLLIEQESLEPVAAQQIADGVIRRARADGLEASGITSDIIDAVALLIIGRELGVEVEEISRYLAPRRYLGRRTATGGPETAATRAALDQDRLRLGEDTRWLDDTVASCREAEARLDALVGDVLAEAEQGGRY